MRKQDEVAVSHAVVAMSMFSAGKGAVTRHPRLIESLIMVQLAIVVAIEFLMRWTCQSWPFCVDSLLVPQDKRERSVTLWKKAINRKEKAVVIVRLSFFI